MPTGNIDAVLGRSVVKGISAAARSHVHLLVKTTSPPSIPRRHIGKPWIRVSDVSSRKVHKFQLPVITYAAAGSEQTAPPRRRRPT